MSAELISLCDGETLTSLGVSDVALGEAPEREVETFVDVADVLLEVFSDPGELGVSEDQRAGGVEGSPFHRSFRP